MSKHALSPCTFVVVCLFVAGCGGRGEVHGRVAGKVTFQGRPVVEGRVIFSNVERGIHMTAPIKSDGTYEVMSAKGAGLPLATYQVAVCPPPVEAVTGIIGPPPKPKPYPDIPPKYRNPETSGLTLEVCKGENRFDIDMIP